MIKSNSFMFFDNLIKPYGYDRRGSMPRQTQVRACQYVIRCRKGDRKMTYGVQLKLRRLFKISPNVLKNNQFLSMIRTEKRDFLRKNKNFIAIGGRFAYGNPEKSPSPHYPENKIIPKNKKTSLKTHHLFSKTSG